MTRVDFGYKKVSPDEKTELVRGVFSSVAARYDVMNDLMSLGSHRLFKRMTVEMSGVREGQRVLDLAGGTGDLAALLARRVGPEGRVVLADINGAMLRRGRSDAAWCSPRSPARRRGCWDLAPSWSRSCCRSSGSRSCSTWT